MSRFTLPLTGCMCFPSPPNTGPVTLFVFARLINEKSHCYFNFFLVSGQQEQLFLCFLLIFISSVSFLFKCLCPFLELGGLSSLPFVQILHKLGKLALYMICIIVFICLLSSNEYMLGLKMVLIFIHQYSFVCSGISCHA